MNQLVVIAFDHFDDARAALSVLRGLESDGRIHFVERELGL
jgi:hypothetical protein